MSNVKKGDLSPQAGALSLASSVFVAIASFFVLILALSVAPHIRSLEGITGRQRKPDSVGLQISCYVIAGLSLMNGIFAGARARSDPRMALVTSGLFTVLAVAAGALFVRTW